MKEFFQNEKNRNNLLQLLFIVAVCFIAYFLFHNTQVNLKKQNIATGFGFLDFEAGFEIGESVIEYWSDESYLKALYVGVLNTLKVSLLGNIFAVALGVFIGIMSLSSNYLLNKVTRTYIEVNRNIPLLLHLFFWYALLTEVLPSVRSAISILPHTYLSNRGLFLPTLKDSSALWFILITLFVSIILFLFLERRRDSLEIKEGIAKPFFERLNYLCFLLPVLMWFILGRPSEVSYPVLKGFNFNGGFSLSPEFCALFLGLVIYTSAFIAEITRAGINSISKGQWEASHSLGLSYADTIKLVILPQAFRVIVPPLTSQILNLTKNSSLAVAIGYPDFVSVVNTTMNQTGQAIECVSLIMVVYLAFSLSTSVFMNWFNKKYALVER